jgi:(1->4)-alpha-D-glucan 1-alpha-D-glucosylmutase
LLATSTHDTKIGEDGRARLYVLSEIPGEWTDWVNEWREVNRAHKSQVSRRAAPDANEEYRLYQTLLASWPPDLTEPDAAYRQRIREHMRKAVNEAKVNTHWAHPNEPWIEACDRFVDALLTPTTGGEFLQSFVPRARRLAHLGLVNTLAQVVLKITSPGVPDFFQGSEGWNLSLVDPDNRGLIEWEQPRKLAESTRRLSWRELLRRWSDGGIKVRLTAELLRFRREHAALFQEGRYEGCEATGRFAERLILFTRRQGSTALLVIVPRLTASLGCPPLGLVWEDTAVVLPEPARKWRDILTGAEWRADDGSVPVAELFRELPLAVLMAE